MTSQCTLPTTKDRLHQARSRFIDSHADVELGVVKRLRHFGIAPSAHLFGQNIELLRKIKASPGFSKSARAQLHKLLDELTELQGMRCDVVHGRMHVVNIAREPKACFINSRDAGTHGDAARLISLDQFARFTKRLTELATAIAPSNLTPPSSPPPPSPGAAGGL